MKFISLLPCLAALGLLRITDASRGLVDMNWDVKLNNVTCHFSDDDKPEVTVTYVGPKPLGTQEQKYYRQRVMQPPKCDRYIVTGAILPVNEYVPMEQYRDGIMTTFLDINASLLSDSPFWVFNDTTREGIIQFCLQTETYNEFDFATGTELSIITIHVNMTQSFELTATLTEAQKVVEALNTQFQLNVVYCDGSNLPITPDPFQPAQELRVCVNSTSNDFEVVDLREVRFVNYLAFDSEITVIDESANVTNNETQKVCSEGLCYFRTLLFTELFKADTNFDGILEDLTDGYSLEGTALMNFTGTARLRRRLGDVQANRYLQELNSSKSFYLPVEINATSFGADASVASHASMSWRPSGLCLLWAILFLQVLG